MANAEYGSEHFFNRVILKMKLLKVAFKYIFLINDEQFFKV